MGDLADDIIEGACCSDCGVYFEEEHGYPVLCKSCWEEEKEYTNLPIAIKKEL